MDGREAGMSTSRAVVGQRRLSPDLLGLVSFAGMALDWASIMAESCTVNESVKAARKA